MPYKVTNAQLKMWKAIWDIFISDEVFREYYTDYPSYVLTIDDESRITSKKGTLYIPPKTNKDPEGHFIAFEKKGDSIEIFDSSACAYQQFSNNPVLAQCIANRSRKKVLKLTNHPQDLCPGDTFCQTWSIAWLTDMRSLTDAKTQEQAITAMYTIVNTIAHSQKFIDYMLYPPNTRQFNALIKSEQVPDSIINNVYDFVLVSQKTRKEEIARIMKRTILFSACSDGKYICNLFSTHRNKTQLLLNL
jgi:hypothetical protein